MAKSTVISFTSLINSYAKLQSALLVKITSLSNNISTADPSQFLLIQFQMNNVTQMGESISNLVAQVNSIINTMVRNQKTQ